MPVHARVIAGSATTSILTNQVVAQQYELQKVEKRMEDMKAALHLACGVLRQTNYMEPHVSGRQAGLGTGHWVQSGFRLVALLRLQQQTAAVGACCVYLSKVHAQEV